jgi:hypothetical protein
MGMADEYGFAKMAGNEKTKCLPQCYFIHYKAHTDWPATEAGHLLQLAV